MSSAIRPRSTRRRTVPALGMALGMATVLALSACSSSGSGHNAGTSGGNNSSANGGTQTTNASCPPATKKLNLGFVYADTTQNPMQEMAMGAKAAADQDGNVNLTESAPNGVNNTQEVQLLQSVARKATDGVGWESVAPDLFTRALKDATGAGVPIVAVDAAAPANTGVNLFVGNSNTQLGELLGQAFVDQNPNPNGTVVLGNDIPSLQLLVQRMNGVESVIKSKLPNMKVMGPYNSGSDNTSNYTLWKSIVNAHSGATAYIGVGAADGINLPLIEKQTGAHYLIGSADIPPEALTAVKNGQIFALSSPEHWMKGYIAMYELIHSKRTCTPLPQGWWNSGNLLITKSNVDAIIARQKDAASRTAYFQSDIQKQLANPPLQPLSAAN